MPYPAEVLSGLPADSSSFSFVKVDEVLQRPGLRSSLEHGLQMLTQSTAGVLTAELLAMTSIESAAIGVTSDYLGAVVLSGNFEGFLGLMRDAPSLAEPRERHDPPSALDSHRDVEMFICPFYDDLFVAVPASGSLLLAQSPGLLMEIIDRHLDGGDIPASDRRAPQAHRGAGLFDRARL